MLNVSNVSECFGWSDVHVRADPFVFESSRHLDWAHLTNIQIRELVKSSKINTAAVGWIEGGGKQINLQSMSMKMRRKNRETELVSP